VDHRLRLVIHKYLCYQSMNNKEIAEQLASCGLTPDTFGAAANALIYQHRRDNAQRDPETPWQVGFSDCLRQLEAEAMQISAVWPTNE
jgi:hypothetical protein